MATTTGAGTGGACLKSGEFGTALRQYELHRSWCKNCEKPLMTRTIGKVLCERCRRYMRRTAGQRTRARAALAFYWVKIGLFCMLFCMLGTSDTLADVL